MASGMQQSMVTEEITMGGSPESKTKEFKQFDIVTDWSDHHFRMLNRPGKDGVTCDQLKIMQEWKILEKNLPQSIYVRVYEARIDLLRAVIVGASGTPYHDSLFFFDFAFPFDYPNNPPRVRYLSHNLHLNPNLYPSGYVCLSLLNTWSGQRNQKWNPSESTILQVLVSLQALVLNEKPFYNEPGVKPDGGILESASRSYTEDVFLLSCKTMLYSLKKPPKNFEAFIAEHFLQRGDVILAACKAYTEGVARVGCFYVDEGPSGPIRVSSKFKKSMNKLYEELDAAFAKKRGSPPYHSKPSKTIVSSSDHQSSVKKKFRIGMNFMGKMKWILRLQKMRKKPKKNA